MWHVTHNPLQSVKDVNKELMDLETDLTEEEARAAAWEFLWHNPAFFFHMFANFRIYPFQELMLKGWFTCDYNMAVWSRGAGKSSLAAWFIIMWAIANPGCKIVVVSFAFRSARRILEECERFINRKDSVLLKNCFPKNLSKKADMFLWELPNGSTITALPLGDGTKIRGIRADVLLVDEFAYMPENVIPEVLEPFLAANSNIQEQLETKDREDRLIAQGKMSEEQRTKVSDRKKVIFLSSACYQFEHMYKKYLDWTGTITDPTRRAAAIKAGETYFISRIAWDALPDGLLNRPLIESAKRNNSEAMFSREYGAEFTQDSSGMFRASKIKECSVPNGEAPCLELVGTGKGAEYVLAIDVSSSSSDTSDFFAMTVEKIVPKEDGSKIGMPVHFYAVAGGDLKDHILYLLYLIQHFNIVYIGVDASQGDNVEFVSFANQSQLFKTHRIELMDIDADFNKDAIGDLPKQIKKGYNRSIGKIVQKQGFGSIFQKAANDYLAGCIDHKRILFGGKISAHPDVFNQVSNFDISFLKDHAQFKSTEGNPYSITDFIEWQDSLLDLTQKQLTLIEPSVSKLGQVSYDLSQNARRTTGPNRVRKDLYSSLLLCHWCVRLYLASQEVVVEQSAPDFPYWLGG